MEPERRAALVVVALGVALASCHRDRGHGGGAGASAPGAEHAADAAPPAAPSASAASDRPGAPPAHVGPACRAIGIRGEVHRIDEPDAGSSALHEGEAFSDGAWLSVAAASHVTVHVADSGREMTVLGPAFVRACAHGEEALDVAYGTVSAAIGLGARPGAEVLVATPEGFVRYGEAALRVEVPKGDATAKLAVTAGAAAAVLPAGVRVHAAHDAGARKPLPGGGFPVRAGDEVALARDPATGADAWARSTLDACRKAADAAADVAASFGTGEPGSIGERTAHLVETRGRARSACAVATAAVAAAHPDAPMPPELSAADARFRALPAHASPPTR